MIDNILSNNKIKKILDKDNLKKVLKSDDIRKQMKAVNMTDISTSTFFILELTTTIPNQEITLPHFSGYTHNYIVDYGDNSGSKVVTSYNDANCTHIYAVSGTYQVKIKGTCETFWVSSDDDIRLTITKVESWGDVGIKYMRFYRCENLTNIPNDFIGGLKLMTSFNRAFFKCSSLVSIPSGLFCYCSEVTTFEHAFDSCSSLTSIPSGLFDYCPLVESFFYTFIGLVLLEFIPPGLFDNCSEVTTFYGCFEHAEIITEVPEGLFDYCPLVENFRACFYRCYLLSSIPSNLFDNCLSVTSFKGTFYYCNLQGTATELWERLPEPEGLYCYYHNYELTNYADIPEDWKQEEP